MKGVTKAMGQMNRQMNLPSLQRIMQEFERQNEKMELVSEVMGDAIDDALEGDEEEEETDDLVNQVLDEIGIDINSEVSCCSILVSFLLQIRKELIIMNRIIVFPQWRVGLTIIMMMIFLLFHFNKQLLSTPASASVTAPTAKNRVAQAESAGNEDSGIDDDLQARLDNLRKM